MSATMRARTFVRRTLALAYAEVLHVVRDKATLFQIVVMPLVQLMVLSNVATFALRQSPLYVVDLDGSPTSRGMVTRLGASRLFRVAGVSQSSAAATDAMLHGSVTLVVTIPGAF